MRITACNEGELMAKSSRIKVPKRVAGVKIPKAIRKGPVMDFVNSKAGKMLLAEALTAAIGVLAYKRAGINKVKKGAENTRDVLARNTARLSFAFGEAITAFRTALAGPGAERSDAGSAAEALAQRLEQVKERVGKKKKKQNGSRARTSSQP
jgi:hypothetical protein